MLQVLHFFHSSTVFFHFIMSLRNIFISISIIPHTSIATVTTLFYRVPCSFLMIFLLHSFNYFLISFHTRLVLPLPVAVLFSFLFFLFSSVSYFLPRSTCDPPKNCFSHSKLQNSQIDSTLE